MSAVVRLLRSQLATASLWSFGINACGAGVSLVTQLIAVRVLQQSGYGSYLYALAWMNALQTFARLEVDRAAVRYIGAYHATGAWALLAGFRRWSTRVLLVAVTTSTVIGIAVAVFWRDALANRGASLDLMLITAALLPLSAFLLFVSATLQAYGSVVWAQVPTAVLRPLVFLAIILLMRLGMTGTIAPAAAVFANILSTVLALVVASAALRRHEPAAVRTAQPAEQASEWWGTVRRMIIVGASQVVLSQQADLLVVGTFLDPHATAVYGAASQITLSASLVISSIGFVAAPQIAQHFARGDGPVLQRLVTNVSRISILAMIPVMLLLLLGGRWLLGLYGAEFTEGYPVLVILTASQFLLALWGSLGGFLVTMTDRQDVAALIIGASALANLILTLLLTPSFGLVGTATATLLATGGRGLALAWFAYRRMGVRLLPI